MSPLKSQQNALALQAQDGNTRAADRLLASMEGYVKVVARRYARATSMPVEDIQQAARMGIVLAIPRYDPSRGSFSAAASFWILQEIRAAIDSQNNAIVFPASRPIKALKYRLPRVYPAYLALGLSPEVAAEMSAKELGLDPEEVKRFLAARGPAGQLDDEDLRTNGADEAIEGIQRAGMLRALSGAMSALSEDDQTIVRMWSEGESFTAISAHLGINSKVVSLRHKAALAALKDEVVGDGFELSDLL